MLATLAGLGHVGCSDGGGADGAIGTQAQAYTCEPDDPVCNQDAGAPRPRWSEQPTRVPVVLLDGGVSMPDASGETVDGGSGGTAGTGGTGGTGGNAGTGGRFEVVACNPDLLGKMPENPNPRGPDLQNITTNFHVLQSLQLFASIISKVIAAADKFDTNAGEEKQKGFCLCHPKLPCAGSPDLDRQKVDREACENFCDPNNTGPGDHAVCSSGLGAWTPNEVFKTNLGKTRFALELIRVLDNVPSYIRDGGLADALRPFGGDLENLDDILRKVQCYIDLYTEGYHLGSYSQQRPDLHMCVPWAGHGAYSSFADSKNGKWGIGARYTSHNLSEKHRAQLRTGGFAVTAFGKSLSIAPALEFNLQVDGYRWFNREAPLGIKALGALDAGGVELSHAKKLDIFNLVNDDQLRSLDSDRDGRVSPQEFLIATFMPFPYSPQDYGAATWPRPGATGLDEWDGKSAAVMAAAMNLQARLKPLTKELPGIKIAPGATLTPYFKLAAGAEWHDEAYKVRKRLQEAINKHSVVKLDTADFERNMHPFQAPDLTADYGTKISVKPEIGANLLVGIDLGKRVKLGVNASIGFSVDIRPGGSGGVVDMSRALEQALVNSNPKDDLECKPNWTYKDQSFCSNRLLDGSDRSFACSRVDTHNSCCLRFLPPNGAPTYLCLDDWTGVTEKTCNFKDITDRTLGDFVSPSDLNEALKLMQYKQSATWHANKSCDECKADGTCPSKFATPDFPDISGCEKHGYCCMGSVSVVFGSTNQKGTADGTGTQARFQSPNGAAYDAARHLLYVGDWSTVRRLDLATGAVTTIAGSGTTGYVDGTGTAARFFLIGGLALDEAAQNLYVTDIVNGAVRKIVLATRQVSTVANTGQGLSLPQGIAYADQQLWVSDVGTSTIWRIALANNQVSWLAGGTDQRGFADGVAADARFDMPRSVVALNGRLYVADQDNNRIRMVSMLDGQTLTVLGNGQYDSIDGVGTAAAIGAPYALSVAPGGDALYIATGETPRHIRKFSPSTGAVSTIVGAPSTLEQEGAPLQVNLNMPSFAVEDADGTLWFGDGNLYTVRKLAATCDQELPGSVVYDVTESQCAGGVFTPYRCVTETRADAQGWTGPGCHPLHSGFQSACGCASNLDCATGETCDVAQRTCVAGGKPVGCSCDPAVAGSCGAGRSCDNGACARRCTYNPSAPSSGCGPDLTCSISGTCVPKSGVQFAEQVIWAAKHPTAPMHAIATYAMTELELIAALNAGVWVGLEVKLFKNWRKFTLFNWRDSWDIGSIEKAWFQPGLEASYQWDNSPLGWVTNYQSDRVTRYPATTTGSGFERTHDLLTLCASEMPHAVENPIAPQVTDIGTSIADTVDFGFDVGEQVYATENLCIGGRRMLDWLQDESAVTWAFGPTATCSYVGPVAGSRGPTTFPCDKTHLNLLRLWGCLDVNRTSHHAVMAQRYPAAVIPGSPATLDVTKILIDPSGPLEASNVALVHSSVQPFFDAAEACFNDRHQETVACSCSSDADCTSGPGQVCSAGVCKDPNGTTAQCPTVRSSQVKVEKCCGDAVVQLGEQCDFGTDVAGDSCSPTCQFEGMGACCLPNGCSAYNGTDAASRCNIGGGYFVAGKTCAEIDSCGIEVTGSCQLGGECLSPSTEQQCVSSGGAFTANGSCRICTPRPVNLSGWYPLDERAGTTALDFASGHHGAYEGTIAHGTGMVRGSAHIDQRSELVRIPDGPSVDFGTGDLTISAWIRAGASSGTIVEKRQPSPVRGYLFMFYGSGFLLQLADDRLGWFNYVSPAITGVKDGNYHHLALSIQRNQSNGGRLYVDGVLRWTFNPMGRAGSLDSTAPLTVGYGYDNPPLNGDIDELMLARRALSQAEIQSLVQAGSNGACR